MRIAVPASGLAATVLLGSLCLGQERPLGDVARETRARTAAKAVRVLTNEDASLRPVTATDDPLTVLEQAADALLRDTSHRCVKVISGNLARGGPSVAMIEVAGVERFRMTRERFQPSYWRSETILISGDVYQKEGPSRWMKQSGAESLWYQGNRSTLLMLPEPASFGDAMEGLKLVGPEVHAGAQTFHYRSETRDGSMNRTLDIWVGSQDSLPRETDLSTYYTRSRSGMRETTSCTFDPTIKVEAPK